MLSLQPQPDAITSEQCDLIQSTWKEVARPKNSTESNVIGLTIGMAFYDVCVVREGLLYRIGPAMSVRMLRTVFFLHLAVACFSQRNMRLFCSFRCERAEAVRAQARV
jgi:hypothetical protein